MKPMLYLGAVALVAVFATSCGGGDKSSTMVERSPAPLREVKVTLQGYAGPEELGILMALKRGFFKDVGLSVWVGAPIVPANPVSYVANKVDDFGVTQLPQLVVGNDKGARVTAVGSLISRPTLAMAWLKRSKIRGIAGLAGKTIAVPGITYERIFLESLLAGAGLTLDDVRLKRVGYDLVPALLKGEADVIFGASANLEGAVLESRGAKPILTGARSLGIPACEETVVITRSELAAKEPDLVHEFMAAVDRGVAAALEDPAAAVRVVAESPEADPSLGSLEVEAEVKATLPLLSQDSEIAPKHIRCLAAWMKRHGM